MLALPNHLDTMQIATAQVEWAGRPLLIDPLFFHSASEEEALIRRTARPPVDFAQTAAPLTSEVHVDSTMSTQHTEIRFLGPITSINEAAHRQRLTRSGRRHLEHNEEKEDEGYQGSDELEAEDDMAVEEEGREDFAKRGASSTFALDAALC